MRIRASITRDPWATFQITPDRSARNWHAADLARALHEIYTPPLGRVNLDTAPAYSRTLTLPVVGKRDVTLHKPEQIHYRPQESIIFEVTMEPDRIRFWLTVPERWAGFAKTKLETVWPRATVQPGKAPGLDPSRTTCAEVGLRHHNFYALATARNDNRPLPAVLEVARDLREGDLVRLQIVATPLDRDVWQADATQAYEAHRKGKQLHRLDYSPGALVSLAGRGIDALFNETAKTLGELLGDPEKPNRVNGTVASLRQKRALTDATTRKISEPVFATTIRIGVQAEKPRMLVRALANALNDLSADNELVRRDLKPKARLPEAINAYRMRPRLGASVLSAGELAKFLQMPGAELQDQYPTIDQVPLRETALPSLMTASGMLLGYQRLQGRDIPVYLPTGNKDELCLPHVVIGGMGTGKTTMGANLAVEAVRSGFGAVVIDPARGEIGDEVEQALPPEQVVRFRFGDRPVALDWREVTHADRARNRFANELIGFVEAATDEAGAQTVRFLRGAAKAVPSGRLSEVVSLLTDSAYRASLIPQMRPMEQALWLEFSRLTEARQAQVAMPVLNRLDVVMGDDYLAECMSAPEGLDLVRLLESPKAVILDVPKELLGAEAVDVLASLVASKLNIAMVLRRSAHPVLIIQDEPHQYMRSARSWRAAAVESRKYRFSYCWLFHAWEQIPRDVAAIIKAAGPHYHLFKSSKATYRELAEEISPFTLEEAMATPRWWAINVVHAGNRTVPPFLCRMAPPPGKR